MKQLTVCLLYLLLYAGFAEVPAQEQLIPPVKTVVDLTSLDIDTLAPDTLTAFSHIYHPLYKQFPIWMDLGNLGFPAASAKWASLSQGYVPHHLSYFFPYSYQTGQLEFFDTHSPYAYLFYSSGGAEDVNGQVIQAKFARHISPQLKVNTHLDFISSPGHYTNQDANHSEFFVNFDYRSENYQMLAGISTQSFRLGENGGLKEPVTSPWNPAVASGLPVNLNNAASNTSLTTLQGRQEISIFDRRPVQNEKQDNSQTLADDFLAEMPDSLEFQGDVVEDTIQMDSDKPRIFHSFLFQNSTRRYADNQVIGSAYYDHFFLSDNGSNDSLRFLLFQNTVGLTGDYSLREKLGLTYHAGFTHHFVNWLSNNYSLAYQQVGVFGRLTMNLPGWRTDLQANIRLLGPAPGSYQMRIRAKKNNTSHDFALTGELGSSLDLPGVSFLAYSGNHDRWLQRMRMQGEHYFQMAFSHRPTGIQAEAGGHLISQWAYFDTLAVAKQTDYTTVLANLQLSKQFHAGPFSSRNLIFLQYTPAQEIPLPHVVASSTNYLHHDILFPRTNGKLEIEYGVDIRYVSAYSGYAYRPSSGAFFLRNGNPLGNYPFIDLFLTLRVKRTRVFVKWEHGNGGFTGNGFFPVENYPVKMQFLKYGVYWHFYD